MKRKVVKRAGGPSALGVYIFAGGFTVGVSRHFNVRAHLEDGEFGVATSRRNFPGMPIHTKPDEWPIKDYRGVDFVYANPPCAPWSVANFGGKNWKDDPRISCFARVLDVVRESMPKVAVIESVRGAFDRGREMMDKLASDAAALGYACDHLLTDAANHRVPQTRKRYFMVLRRVEIDWQAPGGEPLMAGQALRGIKPGRGDVATPMHVKLLKRSKPGERLAKVFDRTFPEKVAEAARKREGAMRKVDRFEDFEAFKRASWENRVIGRPSFLKYVVHPERPAPAVTGGSHLFHWKEPRMLSVRETQVLCSYPPDFEFEGSVHDAHAQIGKAVMPLVGEWIAAQAKAGIKAGKRARAGKVRVVEVHRDRVEVRDAA